MKRLVIGSDNAAFDMKEMLKKYLSQKGYVLEDVGCSSEQDATY